MGPGTPLLQAFSAANDVLRGAVQGIAELITRPGLINVDFADVRTVMSEMGKAMMGSGAASGPDRAEEAAEAAIASPLLEDIDLSGARGILVNITAGPDFAIDEFETVGNAVKAFASENATVVATGIGAERKPDISLVSSEGSRLTQPAKEYGNTQSSEPRSAVGGTEGNQALKADDSAQPENDLEYL